MVKRNRLNKKGVFQLPEWILGFVVVIIILGVMATIIASVGTTVTSNVGLTTENKSITCTGGVCTLWSVPVDGFQSVTINYLNNVTNNTIGSNNYHNNYSTTGGNAAGIVTLKAGMTQVQSQGANPVMNLSFTITAYNMNAAYNSTAKGGTGIGNFSNQMPLLATILVFVVIIAAVVFLANAFRGRT